MDWTKLPNVKFAKISYENTSPVNKAWDEYVKSKKTPLQWIVDKYCKNKNLKATCAKWDIDSKGFKLTYAVNPTEARDIDVTYDDICNEFNWKSFKILNKNTCIPSELSLDEINEKYAAARAKTSTKDRKWLKEHPDFKETDPNHVSSAWKH